MPLNVKESYHNSFVEFISDIGSDKFLKVAEDTVKKMSVNEVSNDFVKNVNNIVKEENNES